MKCRPVYMHDKYPCIQCAMCGADGTREDLSQNECKGLPREIKGELLMKCPRTGQIFEMGEVFNTTCSRVYNCEFYGGRVNNTITCYWKEED